MARKNPEHMRTEMEFRSNGIFVSCSCGAMQWIPEYNSGIALIDAAGWINQHHANFPPVDVYRNMEG